MREEVGLLSEGRQRRDLAGDAGVQLASQLRRLPQGVTLVRLDETPELRLARFVRSPELIYVEAGAVIQRAIIFSAEARVFFSLDRAARSGRSSDGFFSLSASTAKMRFLSSASDTFVIFAMCPPSSLSF
jgi:hypothetical protein